MKRQVLALALTATSALSPVLAAQPRAPMNPAQVQADALFKEPFVDIDECGATPRYGTAMSRRV